MTMLIDTWKEWRMTEGILLIIGVLMSLSGFYVACTLSFAQSGSWIVCSLFAGVAGIFILVYTIVLVSKFMHLRIICNVEGI